MKVAIQGIEASFHALAARRLFGDTTDLVFCKTFKEVFERTKAGEAQKAVVAIENSLYGSINEVYDYLLRYRFAICGEVYEKIGLHVLGVKAGDLAAITDIYSQAPALAEAEAFLDEHLPKAQRHEYADTALAAQDVATWQDPHKAAIASSTAATTYSLSVLASNVETHHENYTRFLGLDPSLQTAVPGANKTSITFRTADTPGSLHAALGIFAERSINLSKLESRPIIGEAWQYMYYLDFDTLVTDDLLQALAHHATDIRVLGSYKSGTLECVD